jgi:sec-independent protein translocase protein TatA
VDPIGPWGLLVIVVVLAVLFGSSRLPRSARSLGEGLREFRNALHEASQPAGPESPDRPPAGEAAQPDGPAAPAH